MNSLSKQLKSLAWMLATGLTASAVLTGCGSSSSSSSATPAISLLAGSMGGDGSVDGAGAAVMLSRPRGLTMGSDNNLYLTGGYKSDYTVRRITLAGVASSVAGAPRSPGTGGGTGGTAIANAVDGTGAAAGFGPQFGVVRDSAGNLYTASVKSHTIRKITPAGVVTTLAGTVGVAGSADGTGVAASFNIPHGLAVDSTGTNLYVADKNNNKIRQIVIATGVVTTLAGSGTVGSADGTGAAATFYYPGGLAIDSTGTNLYVADKNSNKIRQIVIATGVVTTLAGSGASGSADGTGAAATFSQPKGLAIDSTGTNLYVADKNSNKIRQIVIATGVVTTLAGSGTAGGANGTGAAATFDRPGGIAIDSTGTNLYVAEGSFSNQSIRKIVIATGVVTTLTGSPMVTGFADGTGSAATFGHTKGVVNDSAGNVYVADAGRNVANNIIRKITPSGVVTTLAGTAGVSGSADGIGAAATFNQPVGLAIDSTGTNLYVADKNNYTIRRIVIATGVVTTLAGTAGSSGSTDGTGAAATFNRPKGLAVDSTGTNLYVADRSNNKIRQIVIATGVVTTLAGSGASGNADGTGAAATFNTPSGLAVDSTGTNLYVADKSNNTIRKIVIATGVVTTLAGTAGTLGSADGTGAAATFNQPEGLAIDSTGNLYVVDRQNSTIRKVTPAGVVTTVAGTAGHRGFSASLLPAPRFASILGNKLYVSARHGVVKVSLP